MKNKHIDSIKSAMYNTPYDYKTSEKYYSQMLNEKIQETYEFSSDTFEIEVEETPGTMEFKPIVCRVCHAIEPKTGLQRGDDFKELKFFDLNYPKGIGTRYRFDNSIWITNNTDNTKFVTKSNVIRRCNNVLKYIDEKGNIIEEPCVIDYATKYSNVYYNNYVFIPQGTIVITAQNNDNAKNILINDRFIFDSQVYKIKSKNDFLRESTFEKGSAMLVKFEANLDETAPDDDFDLGIASMNKYKDVYKPDQEITEDEIRVVIDPDISSIMEGETVTFSCYLYQGSNKLDNNFEFFCESIKSSFYDFTIIDKNHFSIKNNKMDLNQYVVINCKSGDYEKKFSYQLRGLF